MDSKNRYLPLWYETGSPDHGTYFIGRHYAAREIEVHDRVCDYSLYPILRDDADTLLFQTVRDVVMYPDLEKFEAAVHAEFHQSRKPSYDSRITWYRPHLLFPAADPYTRYEAHEKELPYIVGCFFLEKHIYNESGFYEDDDTPLFHKYYKPQWEWIEDVKTIVYTECYRTNEDDMVMLLDNTEELKLAIQNLLQLMTDVKADEPSWFDRLQTTLRMIDTHANELHILHQAGLYDIAKLWDSLGQKGLMTESFEQVKENMICQLRRYAMLTINLINWKCGGIDSSRILSKSQLQSRLQILKNNAFFNVRHGNDRHDACEPSTNKGFDWDHVYPQYPYPRKEGETMEDYECRRREWLFYNSR